MIFYSPISCMSNEGMNEIHPALSISFIEITIVVTCHAIL